MRWAGVALTALGLVGAVASGRALGPALTPFPKPRRRGELVRTGVYGLVRHPIYSAVLLAAIGWTLARGSAWTLAGTLALAVLFDRKSRREETFLLARHPEYAAYQRTVRRLIPGVY